MTKAACMASQRFKELIGNPEVGQLKALVDAATRTAFADALMKCPNLRNDSNSVTELMALYDAP
jgi:hypothetical protein